MAKLGDIVNVLRSKNAGPFQITIDLMFDDRSAYQRVVESNKLTPELVGSLYRADPADVLVIPFERIRSIKITVPRRWGTPGSGSSGDRDVYGAQGGIVNPLKASLCFSDGAPRTGGRRRRPEWRTAWRLHSWRSLRRYARGSATISAGPPVPWPGPSNC